MTGFLSWSRFILGLILFKKNRTDLLKLIAEWEFANGSLIAQSEWAEANRIDERRNT